MARIRWIGLRGLRWHQVLQECQQLRAHVSGPIILVIHAGGNDVGYMRSVDIISAVKSDIAQCCALFNNLTVVWSEIVPRSVRARDVPGPLLEHFRRKVNAQVAKFVRQIGGIVVRHRDLEGDNRDLLCSDGVHLNDIGMDIFNLGLQRGVEQALAAVGRPSVDY